MKLILSFAISCILAWPCSASAQSYFLFDAELPMAADGSLTIHPANPLEVQMDQGNSLRLTPPDMALIPPARIISFASDTISRQGPDEIVMDMVLDTLFLTEAVYLTTVPVEVRAFDDRTFEGVSTLGRGLLAQIGRVSGGLRGTPAGQGSLIIEGVDPSMVPASQRFDFYLGSLFPFSAGFPFQQGDLAEIRLISCNNLDDTFFILEELEYLFEQQPVYCASPSVDPAIPPSAAVARLGSQVTVRYFEAAHAQRAEALAELISGLFGIAPANVQTEDMRPFYGGNTPIQDYIEIWIN